MRLEPKNKPFVLEPYEEHLDKIRLGMESAIENARWAKAAALADVLYSIIAFYEEQRTRELNKGVIEITRSQRKIKDRVARVI